MELNCFYDHKKQKPWPIRLEQLLLPNGHQIPGTLHCRHASKGAMLLQVGHSFRDLDLLVVLHNLHSSVLGCQGDEGAHVFVIKSLKGHPELEQ